MGWLELMPTVTRSPGLRNDSRIWGKCLWAMSGQPGGGKWSFMKPWDPKQMSEFSLFGQYKVQDLGFFLRKCKNKQSDGPRWELVSAHIGLRGDPQTVVAWRDLRAGLIAKLLSWCGQFVLWLPNFILIPSTTIAHLWFCYFLGVKLLPL